MFKGQFRVEKIGYIKLIEVEHKANQKRYNFHMRSIQGFTKTENEEKTASLF